MEIIVNYTFQDFKFIYMTKLFMINIRFSLFLFSYRFLEWVSMWISYI